MKKTTKDFFVIGFALFAMFFGAGNLIFPPFLGHAVGKEYFIAIIGFIITGVGLPLLAIIACTKGDGTFKTMASKVGPRFAIIFSSILFIAIGPLLGIPRTAATTFELTINPIFPGISNTTWILIYFAINLFFVFSKTSVIDLIGKFLTPILLVILGIVIFKGIFLPIGPIEATSATNVFSKSLIEGYQTMDALGALIFASIVSKNIMSKGYSKKEVLPMAIKSSVVAAVFLAFVYGGLTFIGAQTTSFASEGLTNTSLLLLISQRILGSFGTITIGAAMGVACLTTSIGLISAGASFFEDVTKGKLSFKVNAIVISIVSILIANLGVDKIIKLSGPILNILYPAAITLIITTLLNKFIKNISAVKLGVYTSLVFGILSATNFINLDFIPLASLGFAWVIPTIIAISLGHIVFRKKNNSLVKITV